MYCLWWDGFPDLWVKNSGIYKAERERIGLKKKKEPQTGKERGQTAAASPPREKRP